MSRIGQVDDDEFTIGLGSVGQREDSLKNRGGLIGGRRLSDPEVPTKLALLSVKGAGRATVWVSVQGVIAQEVVDASLVGIGIGDADTGIVGVCLCWWNAEGCQCYGCCRRPAH